MPSRKPSRRKARFARFGLSQPTDIASKGIAFAVPFLFLAAVLLACDDRSIERRRQEWKTSTRMA